MLFIRCRSIALATVLVFLTLGGCGRQLQRVVAPSQRAAAEIVSDAHSIGRVSVDDNRPPLVQIIVPPPGSLLGPPVLRSGHTIRWVGSDHEDGSPVSYKFKFFSPTDNPPSTVIAYDPDSVRRLYAPGYEGWQTTTAEHPQTAVPDGPLTLYALVVVGVDSKGATTEVFTTSTNVLSYRLVRVASGPWGPRIIVFNEWAHYATPSGVPPTDPPFETVLDIPARTSVTLNWSGEPGTTGVGVSDYRWALDIEDVFDETPRRNKNDLAHWSEWSMTETSATVGSFRGREAAMDHVLCIEARDLLGDVSLLAVRLRPLTAPDRVGELLIVDDTRLLPDQLSNGQIGEPRGPWPTAAELDTFLYARGGFPWEGYPTGTMSAPGVFAGYDFDTLTTRTGTNDLTVPLETLLQYRHVVWITDAVGATHSRAGSHPTQPSTALRYMSIRSNTLAAYVMRGGRLWVIGGGAGLAASIANNDPLNDVPTMTFAQDGRPPFNELGPGRFMWEIGHWRSAFRVATGPYNSITRASPRHWPDGSRFPTTLDLKTPATDPLPPLRAPADFYRDRTSLEFLIAPNDVLEDQVPGRPERPVTVMDTVYQATSDVLGLNAAPIATYYHGADHGSVLFMGVDLWSFRRSQCEQLVHAVLQGLWGQSRTRAAAPHRNWLPTLAATKRPQDASRTRQNPSRDMTARTRRTPGR